LRLSAIISVIARLKLYISYTFGRSSKKQSQKY